MPGLAEVAIGAAPIFGGAVLGAVAGNLKGPDMRGLIKQDVDLLERLPQTETTRRAELQRTIDLRVDDLIAGVDRNRALRQAAASYEGNWRDIVLFAATILFTIIWWHVDHSRSNWLPLFIVLIVMSVVAFVYAARGIFRSAGVYMRGRRQARRAQQSTG